MYSRLTRSALAFGLLALVCHTLSAADDAQPIKVGVFGLDNYQSVAFTQLFNSPKAEGDLAGFKVVSAVPTVSPDIPESVDALPKWEAQIQKFGVEIDKNPADMLKRVDCVIMTSLDGRTHLKQATEVLKAGKRLFIARPLAASLADAVAIFEVSKQTGTPCFSLVAASIQPGLHRHAQHRRSGRRAGLRCVRRLPDRSDASRVCLACGPFIDTLYTIMGPGVDTVRLTSTPKVESVTAVWKDGRVATYRGIKEGKRSTAPRSSARTAFRPPASTATACRRKASCRPRTSTWDMKGF